MLMVKSKTGNIDNYKIEDNQVQLDSKIDNGVEFFKNKFIEIMVRNNEKNDGQNVKISDINSG